MLSDAMESQAARPRYVQTGMMATAPCLVMTMASPVVNFFGATGIFRAFGGEKHVPCSQIRSPPLGGPCAIFSHCPPPPMGLLTI